MNLQPILWIVVVLIITGCSPSTETMISKYNIGIVSYGKNENTLRQYRDFQNYLGTQLNSIIEIEPVYNEVKAIEQISQQKWDLVFAPPGLAAIAIARHNYQPVVPLEGKAQTRSVIVVKNDSNFKQLGDLARETIALGEKGSATGYYLPLYNLYGVNLAEIALAPTPQEILKWLEEGKVAAGALSVADYSFYRRNYPPNRFREIYLDERPVPPGAVLISDRLESNQQAKIIVVLSQTPSFIAASAGFLPKEKLPDYNYLIKVLERVEEISQDTLPANTLKQY